MTDPSDTPWRNRAVLVMTSGGTNPQVVINALARHFPQLTVLLEQQETKATLIRRRARHLGWITALGQLGTMVVSRLGKTATTRRTAEIIAQNGLSGAVDPAIPVVRVVSLNDDACLDEVRRLAPAVILTVSCRILSRKTLAGITCPVINLHAGINPGYRGQMGGYWALAEGDRGNFGATVHLVDAGIDTGGTLYDVRLEPGRGDTMMTYPLLLTAAAIPAVITALDDALLDRLAPFAPQGPSKLRYNPPIWAWVWNGLFKGVW